MVINFYLIIRHFRIERLSAVIFSAICGILTADFGSGFVHWAADTWGSIELPVIGKVNIYFE
jgi:plasmanylethanolamine desaturase